MKEFIKIILDNWKEILNIFGVIFPVFFGVYQYKENKKIKKYASEKK